MTPEQQDRIIDLCRQVALYHANANIAERRHEYNHAARLRQEMLYTIGYLKSYIESQVSHSPTRPARRT